MDYPTISLFSGAMGLDIGLMQAGLDIRISQDIDPWCAHTMKANGHACILGDIQELIRQDPACRFLTDATGLGPGEAFAVVGGPPCQPFSTAGRRMGINDPRGSLFMEFAHVIQQLRPRFFLMENVKGLISQAIDPLQRPLDKKDIPHLPFEQRPGSVLQVILNIFEDMGYHTVAGVLDAAHYGVPQFRERLIIIGSRDGEPIFLPRPTHFPFHQNAAYRWQTLRQAIGDLEENPGPHLQFSPERLRYLQMVPMGGNWRSLPPEIIPQAMGGAYQSGGGKVGFYRRLHWDEPSPTLVTSPIQKATMLCHPSQDRPLSVREYARIQQFPDDWIIEGQTAVLYRQIGNAVPIGLGRALGEALIATANRTALIQTRRFRGTSVHDTMLGEGHVVELKI